MEQFILEAILQNAFRHNDDVMFYVTEEQKDLVIKYLLQTLDRTEYSVKYESDGYIHITLR